MKYALGVSLLFCFPAQAGTTNHHAHVHGAAKVTLALETYLAGTIDLDVPAESIYGFEHKASTRADKEAQERGFKPLRNNPYSILRLPSDCEVKMIKVEAEKAEAEEKPEPGEEEHHGEHSDINASYSLKCTNSLAGAKIWVGMFDIFSRVKSVSLRVLTPNGQTEQKITSSHDSLIITK